MAKERMAQPDWSHTNPRNGVSPVPEIRGEARSGREEASPIISGSSGTEQRVYHAEKPIFKAYRVIDNDLARDNVENDIPAADLEDI